MSNTNYAVIYDLHSHTIASDGRLTPEELVHRAHLMRVGTLAITDHDTVAAIPAAQREIERAGLPLALITGVEISTLWENHEIHIVGLNIDIDHPAMTALLDEQKARRQMRGQQMRKNPQLVRRCDVSFEIFEENPAHLLELLRQMPEFALIEELA